MLPHIAAPWILWASKCMNNHVNRTSPDSLLSPLSLCEALFTWLLYSFGQLPIVVVPTVLSAILALVPKVSPVWSISVWAAGYLWLHNQRICAALCHGKSQRTAFPVAE